MFFRGDRVQSYAQSNPNPSSITHAEVHDTAQDPPPPGQLLAPAAGAIVRAPPACSSLLPNAAPPPRSRPFSMATVRVHPSAWHPVSPSRSLAILPCEPPPAPARPRATAVGGSRPRFFSTATVSPVSETLEAKVTENLRKTCARQMAPVTTAAGASNLHRKY